MRLLFGVWVLGSNSGQLRPASLVGVCSVLEIEIDSLLCCILEH